MSAARKAFHPGRLCASCLTACLVGTPLNAVAESISSDRFDEIETHHLFGFTDGSDIAPEGHKELQFITRVDHGRRALSPSGLSSDDVIARIGRGGLEGSYRMIEESVEFEHALTTSFEYSFGASMINHRIRGVDGFDDFNGTNLKGFFAEFRYVLAKRGEDLPFGITIQTQPQWGHVSDAEGHQETAFATSSKLVVDAELIPRRLYGAVNVIYEPEIWRSTGEFAWRRASTLGVTGGLVYRLTPRLALGWGVQYYRTHASLGFGHLTGQALFAGPSLYVELNDRLFVSAAFSTQLRGHASGETHALDLAGFSTRMGWLLVGFEF